MLDTRHSDTRGLKTVFTEYDLASAVHSVGGPAPSVVGSPKTPVRWVDRVCVHQPQAAPATHLQEGPAMDQGWVHSITPSLRAGQPVGTCPEPAWFTDVPGIPGWDMLCPGILLLICFHWCSLFGTFPSLSLSGARPSFSPVVLRPAWHIPITGRKADLRKASPCF